MIGVRCAQGRCTTRGSITALRTCQYRGEMCPGALYNKGKALGMLGRESKAQNVYQEAIDAARGTTASTWTKACASLKSFTQEQIDDMEAAAKYLTNAAGERDAALLEGKHLERRF